MGLNMAYRRRATVRDSPMLCLIFGAALLIASFSDDNTIVPRERLQSLEGTVARVSEYRTGGRHSVAYVDLMLQDGSGGQHEIRQRYGVTDYAPGVMSLQSGEHVATLVQDKGQQLVLWEVTRDGTPVLSYDNTRQFYAKKQHWVVGMRLIVFCLVVAAVFLRLRLGVLREPTVLDD
jgi:hypothetical protein